MNSLALAAPLPAKRISPVTALLLVLAGWGLACGIFRFGFGLAASTNMNQDFPWGIWIVGDVGLIALAAGGFVTAALAHVLHRPDYHILVRPALLTALLGYTFACVLLAADLGRYYNIWHPMLPSMWQGNSALFEVGMCVMCYLTVLYLEFVPVICERFSGDRSWPRLGALCAVVHRWFAPILTLVIILGIAISCLHQSSLGHVMVLARGKLHPLWWTPILALLFLMSAIAAGVPTVVFVALCGWRAVGHRPPMEILSRLSKYLPIPLAVYLAFKVGDMLIRQSYHHLGFTLESLMFLLELVVGLAIPIGLLLSERVRRSPLWLGVACFLVMSGLLLNRANVYWIGYRPLYTSERYFPSIAEWGFTIGAIAGLLLLWRFLARNLPIIESHHEPAAGDAGDGRHTLRGSVDRVQAV